MQSQQYYGFHIVQIHLLKPEQFSSVAAFRSYQEEKPQHLGLNGGIL